jgi:hypothetical protein
MAELYFGFAVNSGTAAGGTTSGFSYEADSSGDGIAYNADVTTAAAPAWGDSGQETGVMMLVYETVNTPQVFPAANQPSPVNRVAVVPVRIGGGSR